MIGGLNIRSAELIIDITPPENGYWSAGDSIEGTIIFETKREVDVSSLTIGLECTEHATVEYETVTGAQVLAFGPGVRRAEVQAHETYFETEQTVYRQPVATAKSAAGTPAQEDGSKFQKGQHKFPFRIELPPNLSNFPPTCEMNPNNGVYWIVTAKAHRPGRLRLHFNASQNVPVYPLQVELPPSYTRRIRDDWANNTASLSGDVSSTSTDFYGPSIPPIDFTDLTPLQDEPTMRSNSIVVSAKLEKEATGLRGLLGAHEREDVTVQADVTVNGPLSRADPLNTYGVSAGVSATADNRVVLVSAKATLEQHLYSIVKNHRELTSRTHQLLDRSCSIVLGKSSIDLCDLLRGSEQLDDLPESLITPYHILKYYMRLSLTVSDISRPSKTRLFSVFIPVTVPTVTQKRAKTCPDLPPSYHHHSNDVAAHDEGAHVDRHNDELPPPISPLESPDQLEMKTT